MADSCASECRVVQLWPSDNINVFCVSVGKTTKNSVWVKGRNFRLFVSSGSAEALVRYREKIKHRLIAYFLSNISAKNYQNRSIFVDVIASQSSVVFETQCRVNPRLSTRVARVDRRSVKNLEVAAFQLKSVVLYMHYSRLLLSIVVDKLRQGCGQEFCLVVQNTLCIYSPTLKRGAPAIGVGRMVHGDIYPLPQNFLQIALWSWLGVHT